MPLFFLILKISKYVILIRTISTLNLFYNDMKIIFFVLLNLSYGNIMEKY